MDEALRALADGTRRRILSLVSETERTAGEIAAHFDISRPAVSQHLKVLLASELVVVRTQGTRRLYRLNHRSMQAVRATLEAFWDERLAKLKQAAEVAEDDKRRDTDMTAGKGTIRREIFIEASQATVFAFFTDPDKMSRWMGVSHDLDPREGGVFLVDVNNEHVARGEFREVMPNSRIVFDWGWESGDSPVPPGSSLIEIELTPKDDGTLLVFTHSGLPEPAVTPHAQGWDHYLGRLAIAATGADAGPDPWIKSAA